MATFETRVRDALTAVGTRSKLVLSLINGNVGTDLTGLHTAAKGNLVAALNELHDEIDALATAAGATIDDATTASTTKTYSVTKIRDLVSTSIAAVTAGAPTALDTLDELAAALGDDSNFAATITAALGNRVRTDTATQGLTVQQKQNARTNIDAYGSQEIGNPDVDLVAVFTAALA